MELVRHKCNDILGNMDQTLSHLKMSIKGLEMKSVFYSKDPVNLSTGNFIYAHTDLSIPGCSPMYFRRFYNSVNRYEGCLGRDWNHNFEVSVKLSGKEMVLHLEDGREERFVSLSNGAYAPLYHDCGEFFRLADGWKYLTRERKEYCFEADGFCTEIQETAGSILRFHYGKESGRRYLLKVEKNTGEYFEFAYDTECSIKEKIEAIARKIYGADGVDYAPKAEREIRTLESIGLGNLPICMAKNQYSLTDDAKKLGRPEGFRITIRDITASAGAGFLVALTGDIMKMPGLPKVPAAEKIDVNADGVISGLF